VTKRFILGLAVVWSVSASVPALADDPGRIDAYVTPYYNSSGPIVKAGTYSAGLAAGGERFVNTIFDMKRHWRRLTFVQLYVAAIRLYDLGYRDESVYWFYQAQYQGRLFALLLDTKAMGNIGSPGFELYHAQDAFFTLAGPDVNAYAFGNIDALVRTIVQTQSLNQTAPDMQAIYPGIRFIPKAQWAKRNDDLSAGLGKLAGTLAGQKDQIARDREENGTAARFARVTSKPFPHPPPPKSGDPDR